MERSLELKWTLVFYKFVFPSWKPFREEKKNEIGRERKLAKSKRTFSFELLVEMSKEKDFKSRLMSLTIAFPVGNCIVCGCKSCLIRAILCDCKTPDDTIECVHKHETRLFKAEIRADKSKKRTIEGTGGGEEEERPVKCSRSSANKAKNRLTEIC